MPKQARDFVTNQIARFVSQMFDFFGGTSSVEYRVRGRSQTMFTRGGGQVVKILTFCKLLYHRKCKRRGLGGQKKTNLINVVCERPLVELQDFKCDFNNQNCFGLFFKPIACVASFLCMYTRYSVTSLIFLQAAGFSG